MVAANATPNAYYRGVDTVTANVLSAEMILKYKQQLVTLKKAKQATNDAVLEFNIRTQIELDEGAVKLLTAQGLL